MAHVVDWASNMGCSKDYKLIVDCLEFLDSEGKVRASKLGLNTMVYLPSVFHFWLPRTQYLLAQVVNTRRSPTMTTNLIPLTTFLRLQLIIVLIEVLVSH